MAYVLTSKNVGGTNYLVANDGQQDFFVYRCLVHADTTLRRGIPSYRRLPGSASVHPALFPFKPIYQTDVTGIQGLPSTDFDTANRGDANPSEQGILHERYNRWQLYIFVGTIDTGKDYGLTGLWERIEIGLALPPLDKSPITRQGKPPPGMGP